VGLIQVSLRPFRADPFIGRFPGLKPRAESRSPLRGIKPAQRALIFAPFTADPSRDRQNRFVWALTLPLRLIKLGEAPGLL
jgi:hypothetical protein